MTAPELKRYWAMQGPIKEAIEGEFVYYRDVQAAIAAAMQGAVRLADGIAGNTKDFNRDYRRAAGQIGALIKASIPTDATAALDTMLAEAEKRGREQALENAACVLDHYHSDDTHTTIAAIWQDEIRAMKGGE